MKQIAFICAAVLLSSALYACTTAEDINITTDTVTSTESHVTESANATVTRIMHNVPVENLDFGGKPFRAMTYDGENFSYYFLPTKIPETS